MPLNGPIQTDGQELKAARTQKPLGSQERSSPGLCPREGRPPLHKAQWEDLSTFSTASLGANYTYLPPPKVGNSSSRWPCMEKADGLEVEMKSQQTTNKQNTLFFISKMGLWARGAEGRLRVPSSYTGPGCIPDTHGDL